MFDAGSPCGPRRERRPEEETARSRRQPDGTPAFTKVKGSASFDRYDRPPLFIPDTTKPYVIVSFVCMVVVAVRDAQRPWIVVPGAPANRFRRPRAQSTSELSLESLPWWRRLPERSAPFVSAGGGIALRYPAPAAILHGPQLAVHILIQRIQIDVSQELRSLIPQRQAAPPLARRKQVVAGEIMDGFFLCVRSIDDAACQLQGGPALHARRPTWRAPGPCACPCPRGTHRSPSKSASRR